MNSTLSKTYVAAFESCKVHLVGAGERLALVRQASGGVREEARVDARRAAGAPVRGATLHPRLPRRFGGGGAGVGRELVAAVGTRGVAAHPRCQALDVEDVPARQTDEHHALHEPVDADGALGVVVAEFPPVLGEDASPRELAEDSRGERLRRIIRRPRILLSVSDEVLAPGVSVCVAVMDELLEPSDRRRSVPVVLGFHVSKVRNQRDAIGADEGITMHCFDVISLLRL